MPTTDQPDLGGSSQLDNALQGKPNTGLVVPKPTIEKSPEDDLEAHATAPSLDHPRGSVKEFHLEPYLVSQLRKLTSGLSTVQAQLSTVGRQVFTPTPGYTPAVGDVVELNYDGKIRKASRGVATNFDTANVPQFGTPVCLDSTHVLGVWWTSASQISAQVFSVDPATLLMTPLQSAVPVATGLLQQGPIGACAISSSLAFVCWTSNGVALSAIGSVTLSIDNSTWAITVNTPVAPGVSACCINCVFIPATGNVFVTYSTATTSITGRVITISGTVPSWAAAATAVTVAAISNAISAQLGIGGGSITGGSTIGFLVSAKGSATPGLGVYVNFAVTGTAVSSGGGLVDGYGSPPGNGNPYPISAEVAPLEIVIFRQSADINSATTIEAGSDSLALFFNTLGRAAFNGKGTPIISSHDENIAFVIDLIAVDGKGLGAAVAPAGNNPSAGTSGAVVYFRKGAGWASVVTTIGDAIITNLTANAQLATVRACVLTGTNGTVVAMFAAGTAANKAHFSVCRPRVGVVGIAVDTTGTVQTSGIVTGLSGLTTGPIGVDQNGNLSSRVGDTVMGIALSSTSMLVQIQRGP